MTRFGGCSPTMLETALQFGALLAPLLLAERGGTA